MFLRNRLIAAATLACWCALIFAASAQPHLRISDVSVIDLVLRKAAHIGVYAVQCVIASMTAAQEGIVTRRSITWGMAFSIIYAISDEWHQSFVPGRNGSALDVAIDGIGIAAGAFLITRRARVPMGMLTPMERPQSELESHTHVLEGELWRPGREWELAIADVAKRYTRVRPLDPAEVLAAGGFAAQIQALESWAADEINWSGDLARFFDGHLSLYVKPDPSVTRTLRSYATEHGPAVIRTVLPEQAAWSIVHHLGIARSVARIESLYRRG